MKFFREAARIPRSPDEAEKNRIKELDRLRRIVNNFSVKICDEIIDDETRRDFLNLIDLVLHEDPQNPMPDWNRNAIVELLGSRSYYMSERSHIQDALAQFRAENLKISKKNS